MSRFHSGTLPSRQHASLDTASGDDTFFDASTSRLEVDLEDGGQSPNRRQTQADTEREGNSIGGDDPASAKIHKPNRTKATTSFSPHPYEKTTEIRPPQLGPDEIRLDDLLACANNALRSLMLDQQVVHDLLSEPMQGPLSSLGPVGCVVRLLYRAVRRNETLASWRRRHQDMAAPADASTSSAIPSLPDTAPRLTAPLARPFMPGARESLIEPDGSLLTDAMAGPLDGPGMLDSSDSVWDAIAKSERLDINAMQGGSMAQPVWQAITKNYSTSRPAATSEDRPRSPPPPGLRAWRNHSSFNASRTSIFASIASITEVDNEHTPLPSPLLASMTASMTDSMISSETAHIAHRGRQSSRRTLSIADQTSLDQLKDTLSNSDRPNIDLANLISFVRDALAEAEEDIRLLEDLNARTLEESKRVQSDLAEEIRTITANSKITDTALFEISLYRSCLEEAIDQSDDRDMIMHTASYEFIGQSQDRAALNEVDAEFHDYLAGKPVPSETKSYYAELHERIKRINAANAAKAAQAALAASSAQVDSVPASARDDDTVQKADDGAKGESMADWIAPMASMGGLGSAMSTRSLRSLYGADRDPDPGSASKGNPIPPSPVYQHLLQRKNSNGSSLKRRGSGRYRKRPQNTAASPSWNDLHGPPVLEPRSESVEPLPQMLDPLVESDEPVSDVSTPTPKNAVPATSSGPDGLPEAASTKVPPSAVDVEGPVETVDGTPDPDPAEAKESAYNELRSQLRARRQARGSKAFIGVELPPIYLPENPYSELEAVRSAIDGIAPPTKKSPDDVVSIKAAGSQKTEKKEALDLAEASHTPDRALALEPETTLTIVVHTVEIVPESVPETVPVDMQARGTQTESPQDIVETTLSIAVQTVEITPESVPEAVPANMQARETQTEPTARDLVENTLTIAMHTVEIKPETVLANTQAKETQTEPPAGDMVETTLSIAVCTVEIAPESVPETVLAKTETKGTQTEPPARDIVDTNLSIAVHTVEITPESAPETVPANTQARETQTEPPAWDIVTAPVADTVPHGRVQAVERFEVPKQTHRSKKRPGLIRRIISFPVRFVWSLLLSLLWQPLVNIYLILHWPIVVFGWDPILSVLKTAWRLLLSPVRLWHRMMAGHGSLIDVAARLQLRPTENELPPTPPYSAHSPSVWPGSSVDSTDKDGNVSSADKACPLAPQEPARPFPSQALADLSRTLLFWATILVIRLAIIERDLWLDNNANLPREYIYTYIKQYERDSGSCRTYPYMFNSFYRNRYASPSPSQSSFSPYHACVCFPTFFDARMVLEPMGQSWLYYRDYWRDSWRMLR